MACFVKRLLLMVHRALQFILFLLLVPMGAGAALRCEALFSPSSHELNFYTVPEGLQAELRSLFARYSIRKNSSSEVDFSISQDRTVKRSHQSFAVRFKQDDGKVSTIVTYGAPYISEGQAYIDFKIGARAWDKISDHKSPVLRRMPYEEFENLILKGHEYEDFVINNPASIFILPNNKNDGKSRKSVFTTYKVKSRLQKNKPIYELVDSNGNARKATINELLFWSTFGKIRKIFDQRIF